jgi:hypothetical protein
MFILLKGCPCIEPQVFLGTKSSLQSTHRGRTRIKPHDIENLEGDKKNTRNCILTTLHLLTDQVTDRKYRDDYSQMAALRPKAMLLVLHWKAMALQEFA